MKPEMNVNSASGNLGRMNSQDVARNSASSQSEGGQAAKDVSLQPQQRTQQAERSGALAREMLSADDIREAVQEANEMMQFVRRDLAFEINDDAERLVVKVKDSQSGEVIRQIPSEEMLEIIARLRDMIDNGENVGAFIEERL